MAEHRARKDLGQNFLVDNNIVDKIIASISPKPGEQIIEIGPGLGALTSKLLAITKSLDVVELDGDVIEPLQQKCAGLGQLTIHHQDALTFDFGQFDRLIRLVGNLPYNISSPLLFHALKNIDQIIDMHFMLQKEVVDRMAASPGSKTYGRLSVMIQYFCQVQPLFLVKPSAFKPQPKVNSTVVRLLPIRDRELVAQDGMIFSKVVKAAFGQRRKTLRNSLGALVTADELSSIGVDPMKRPEQLAVDDFVRIANTISNRT